MQKILTDPNKNQNNKTVGKKDIYMNNDENEISNSIALKRHINIPLIWQGVFWKIFSCACFAGVNALVRFLSGGSPLHIKTPLPIYAIIFFQNLLGLIILIIISFVFSKTINKKDFYILKTKTPFLYAIRALTAISGISLWYLSLKYMTIIQAVALSFIGPILTIIGSKFFLQENFTWQRITSLCLSLIGGFLIIRPDKGLSNAYIGIVAILPILSAALFAFDKLITRKIMSKNDSSYFTLTFYLILFSAIFCIFPCFTSGFPKININIFHWIFLLGLLSAAAHLSFSKAYELAEVTFLMPFGISKCILCGIVGYVAFAELPKTFAMWSGITVILLSSFILNIQFKKNPKK